MPLTPSRVIWLREMELHEITLPDTKPETEWVRGRPLRKMSPLRDHARLQLVLAAALDAWARGRGEVGTEWRFRITPPGQVTRPLVPDIAYVSAARLRGLTGRDLQLPRLAPDVVVEILCAADERIDIDHKVTIYLHAGSSLVVLVDALQKAVELHDPYTAERRTEPEAIEHPALPGFSYSIAKLFSVLEPPR